MALSERDLQVACVMWCRTKDIFIAAIPNGGYRTAREAGSLKAQGVVAGMPDLFIPALRTFVELKAPSGRGRTSEEQEAVHGLLRASGYDVFVTDSFEGFKVLVTAANERYLRGVSSRADEIVDRCVKDFIARG